MSYPDVKVDIILPNEISETRLRKNDVNFILGYDCINAINADPPVKKFSSLEGVKTLEDIYSNPKCKIFPPINHLRFIWDKKVYLTKLHKNNVLISPSIFFKKNNKSSNLLNQIKKYKWDYFIIKPIGGTTDYGFQKFNMKEILKDPLPLQEYFLENNDYYNEYIVQQYISGFRKYGEIKMFWINKKFSYAVNTIDRGEDDYQVKLIKNKKILEECKMIGQKAVDLVEPIVVNGVEIEPALLRTDFTCCLNNDETKKKYFLNEIEHEDAGSYINYDAVDYPYVPVMADTFVKKAEELIDLDF